MEMEMEMEMETEKRKGRRRKIKKKAAGKKKEDKEESSREEEENVESDDYSIVESLCEEERKKKTVYIFTIAEGSAYDIKLMTFNPHEATPELIDKTPDIQAHLPPELLQIRYYHIAVLESKLYFIGGYHLYKETMSNQVFAFDTLCGKWSALPPMRLKRVFPTVLTHQNKIYVFGFACDYLDSHTFPAPSEWAEFYDPVKKEWNPLPNTAPPMLTEGSLYIVHALIEEQGIVIFCAGRTDFHGYSFKTQQWFTLSYPGCFWSNTVAAVKSNLFWHQHGSIHNYEFEHSKKPEIATMCTLPNDDRPSLSFIINAGHGKLCLVYRYEKNLVCHRFELRRSPSRKQYTLHYGGFETCETNDRLFTVLAM